MLEVATRKKFFRLIMKKSALGNRPLKELEKKYDSQFKVVFDVLQGLMEPPAKPKRKIGFLAGDE